MVCSVLLIFSQLDASDSSSSSNLSLAKVRPSSDLNNSTGQSPHHKVQRSVSSSQKQRRYSDHGKFETVPLCFPWVSPYTRGLLTLGSILLLKACQGGKVTWFPFRTFISYQSCQCWPDHLQALISLVHSVLWDSRFSLWFSVHSPPHLCIRLTFPSIIVQHFLPWWKCSGSMVSNRVASSYTWLLGTWTREMVFSFV